MLRPLRNRARSLSTIVVAGVLALWFGSFASTCMAATGHKCESPGIDCATVDVSMVSAPCEQAAAPCELPSLNAPVSGKFDFAFAPAAVPVLTPSFDVSDLQRVPPPSWQAERPAHTPLYLTYLSLLN